MYGDFNPGTSHGRDIFSKKTKGLVDDKKFNVMTKDVGAIRKSLIGKQLSLGKVVTRIPVTFDDTSRPIKFSNVIQQHQLVKFERLQRLGHTRFAIKLRKD